MARPAAFSFDLFGTVVDWRAGVARASAPFLRRLGRDDDPFAFADAWRARYQPAMAAVGKDGRDFVPLDLLHREMLDDLLAARDIDASSLDEAEMFNWAHAWRRLDPWPDARAGLERLRELAPVVTLSNANVALAIAMARFGALRWDAVLGAEVLRAYKPDPATYLGTAALLGIAPGQLCHVAAHHSDLAAARACGLMTAHVARPLEHGGRAAPDADQAQDWDWSVNSLPELAAVIAPA